LADCEHGGLSPDETVTQRAPPSQQGSNVARTLEDLDAAVGTIGNIKRPAESSARLWDTSNSPGGTCALVHLVVALPIFRWLMPLPGALKIAVSLVLIAPLAFFMGMPFPLALVRVAAARPALVPWAWGINGCASVLSAILAILLAMSLGFNAVVLIAIGLYVVAAATLR
jgi:hypothetical protein